MAYDEYKLRGVSATKDDVHTAIVGQDEGVFPGAFCKIFDDIADDANYCVCVHADGAGTKANIAYILYKEKGLAEVFRGIAQDSAVMNIDDVLCVGATTSFLLSNAIGRNAHRVGGDVLRELVRGYAEFQARMRAVGIAIKLVGGETADVGDIVSTIMVDSTIVVRVRRDRVINCKNIKPGHVIVGLASFGRASYEASWNSGIGSNGLTLARHSLLESEYGARYPETFSSTIAKDKVYQGSFLLDDRLPGTEHTVADALLSPTRTYAPIVSSVLARHREKISGLIHCTGGGLVKSKKFGVGLEYIKESLFETPAIFRAILEHGTVTKREMFQVFNMGHRLEIYCEPNVANDIIEIAKSFSVEGKVIGEVRRANGIENSVRVKHAGEEFVF